MLILLFILSIQLYAQDDQAFESYCFANSEAAQRAQVTMNAIVIPQKDRLSLDQECLNISTTRTRIELLGRYLRTRYPEAKTAFSSESNYKECNLEITSKKKKKTTTKNLGLDIINNAPSAQVEETFVESSEVSTMKIRSGTPSQLQLGNYPFQITCKTQDNKTYQIELVYPSPANYTNVPNGFPANYQNPNAIDCSRGINCPRINTSISLNQGETKELGAITKDLGQNSQKVDINQGASQSTTDGNEEIYYSLTAK